METYTFNKEPNGRWYIDLPDFKGPHSALEMVEGADTMLDYVGEGASSVSLILSETPFDSATILTLIESYKNSIGGGTYLLKEYEGKVLDQKMWLCEVTEFVFGKLPPEIYFKKV